MRNAAVLVLLLFPPPSAKAAQSVEIVSSVVGVCTLTVEADADSSLLHLRARHPEYEDCAIDKDSMLALVRAALSRNDPPPPAGGYKSLYIGRLVDHPWLSSYLAHSAAADPGWSSKKGTPVRGDINAYVDALLSRSELTSQLAPALTEAGYVVTGVSIEKVLVKSVEGLPGRVPYDAQVWFRMEKR